MRAREEVICEGGGVVRACKKGKERGEGGRWDDASQ